MKKSIFIFTIIICTTSTLLAQRTKKETVPYETRYEEARNFALAGNPQKSFEVVCAAIDKGFWNINRFKEDQDFQKHIGNERADSVLRKLRNANAPYLQGKAFLSREEKKAVIDLAVDGLKTNYFDASKADTMIAAILQMRKNGAFDTLNTVGEVTRKLTDYLRKETNDKHFYIGVNHNALAERIPSINVTTQAERNYGFREVSIRQGNIGYIRWDECAAGPEACKTAQSALMLMRNTRAIIFDISTNGGGNGEISTFLYHYLFKADDKRFETLLIKRCKGETAWRRSEPPVTPLEGGPDLSDKPVYIVTSDRTFSAAEYFAFVMKELGRATIIGKNTGGGGNPVTMMRHDKFMFYVPICQITTAEGKSLEGKGVAPDIELTSDNWLKEQLEIINADLSRRK